MERLQKSMLKISQSYLNLRQFTLTLLLCITIFTSCTTTSSDEGTVVPPPVPSPLELGDISLVPSGGDSSPYAAATVTIEGAVIVISDIPNLADTTTETLTLNIADKEDPVTYTVEPASVTIPAAVLNPEGTNAVRTRLENVEFVLTPTAAGEEPITYGVEVRLDEFIALTPLVVEDITIAAGSHPAYKDATIVSVSDKVIAIGGIKNKEDGFSEDLTLMIKDKTDPAEYEVSGDAVTLAGAALNPDGITNTNIANNEALTFTVTPTAPGSTPVKYYVHLMLGDLIQLKLLGGELGIFSGQLELLEGSSASATVDALIGECGVFSSSPPFEVLSGGSPVPSTTSYTLTATGGSSINSYVGGQTHLGISLTLTEGTTEINTFPSLTVETSECTVATLSGDGMSSATAYIIDNDRKLNLFAELINSGPDQYRIRHYKVTERIDLGVTEAPWSKASGGAGFDPIGNAQIPASTGSPRFSGLGTFDCQNNEIANLYINRPNSSQIGLFGFISNNAKIENCILVDVDITGGSNVGSLVGLSSNSMISNSSVISGTVSGSGLYVGGLVGNNSGGIGNPSIVINSYARVNVSGTANVVGGLVGANLNNATISNSYATGEVSGEMVFFVGGLAGYNWQSSAIVNSYAAVGTVNGKRHVGGLVGENSNSMISNSYATGSVSGSSSVGGLVGQHFKNMTGNAPTISYSYATGNVTGTGGDVGLFIGYNSVQYSINTVASNFSGVTNSYYLNTATTNNMAADRGVGSDMPTSMSFTSGLEGRSPTDLRGTSFSTWDDNIWEFASTSHYPRLKTVACANRQYTNPIPTECTGL